MSYRNGTYVAFHAEGESNPSKSDFKYYAQLKAWSANEHHDFTFVDSHDKKSAITDRASRATIEDRIRQRLNSSRNMVLIVSQATRLDNDYVPLEIRHAIDVCKIPIIAAYPDYRTIEDAAGLQSLWPTDLASRIAAENAHVIHVPFRQAPILDAIGQFGPDKFPKGGGLGVYDTAAYRRWGLLV